MAIFRPAFDLLMAHEGGYVCNPADPGGETKYGISKRSYPKLNIANLSLSDACDIYLLDWWNPNPYQFFTSQLIANKVFDMAVNMGTHEAHKLLQLACNDCGAMLNCDSQIGALTLKAVNSLDEIQLLQSLRLRQRSFYLTLAAQKPSNERFIKGWLVRADA